MSAAVVKTCDHMADNDDPLAEFLSEVTKGTEKAKEDRLKKIQTQKKEVTFHEKYLNQDLGDGRTQHARLTAENYEWRNLNPYYVLQLGVDATEEDIKNRYRKLSSKVHPDKNRNVENARDSFEEVKKAYQKLLDVDGRRNIVENIEMITRETKDGNKGKSDTEMEELITKAVMKHFAEMEMARRKTDNLVRSNNMREKVRELEKEEQQKQAFTEEKAWNNVEEREKRVGGWREFGGGANKKARLQSFKRER